MFLTSKRTIFCAAYCLTLVFINFGCKRVDPSDQREKSQYTEFFHQAVDAYTDILVHDIFSPPVASRNYFYPLLAAYETLCLLDGDTTKNNIAFQLNNFKGQFPTEIPGSVVKPLCVHLAFLYAGKHFVFSEERIQSLIEETKTFYKQHHVSTKQIRDSESFALQIAEIIIQYASEDNYKQSRTFAKFTINDDPSTWKPTPPAYMQGIEPSWNTIRPLLLNSPDQFQPPIPTPFDLTEGSTFYQEVMEVYEAVKNATDEQIEIANFWDCNPYKMNITGHVMHATKKITPGGHWMSIVGIVAKDLDLTLYESLKVYTSVSIALFEGFISCWDEKYRSILIRPESVINAYIDENWMPLLQTPPFPEYTSGHSVISTAAAEVLTHMLGDNVSFEDSTEVKFGLPIRRFNSFKEAADEAAISRLYGGIHYKPAIINGQAQGEAIGRYVIEKLGLKTE